jgi:hypothetical protein
LSTKQSTCSWPTYTRRLSRREEQHDHGDSKRSSPSWPR